MACTGNGVCELHPKQTEWGSRLNSLRASGSEMSPSTSNMRWRWCRNSGQPPSNCIFKEQDTKDYSTVSWESLFSAVQVSDLSTALYCGNSSGCAEGELTVRWFDNANQKLKLSSTITTPEDHQVHESLAAQLRLWVRPGWIISPA